MREIPNFEYEEGKEYVIQFLDEPLTFQRGQRYCHIKNLTENSEVQVLWLSRKVLLNKVERLRVHYGRLTGLTVKFMHLGLKDAKRGPYQYHDYNLEVVNNEQKKETLQTISDN